jgi:hypothetical protein
MTAPYYRIVQAGFTFAVLFFCIHGVAQTITIRMLNGRSGKPMRDKTINVEFQGSSGNAVITVDKQGIGHLVIPPGATAVSFIGTTKKGKDSNQPAYTVCGPDGQFIPVQDILDHGIVPQNACSITLQLTAKPGELLYLIEPLPWYTPALE